MSTSFTPWAGAFGGVLIGLASALLLVSIGKIAGISGILGRSLFASRGDLGWRLAFLAGLPIGAGIAARLARGGVLGVFADTSPFVITNDPTLLIVGGLLVGYGTQLGNGCTSGHGVCGLARGSQRSLVATVTFLATAMVTVFVLRHVLEVA